MPTPIIIANTENEVLTRIEQIGDIVTRNAVRAIFFWRLGSQGVVSETENSSNQTEEHIDHE